MGSSGNASRGNLALHNRRSDKNIKKSRFRMFQDSILDTCRTLEWGDDDDEFMLEMDPLATVDHTRPDLEQALPGTIGGFQNMGEGTGQTIPVRSSHDSLENLNQEAAPAGERDSQGVSALDEEEEEREREKAFGKRELPRRRDTVLSRGSQLSVDSLYMNQDDRPQRTSDSIHSGR